MDVLLRLGDFKFAVDTAAHESLTRSAGYRWPAQDRLWNAPAVQFTGAAAETIELTGRVLPTFRGGLTQIEQLRQMAAQPVAAADPEPLDLMTGYGEYLGQWVITRIEETQAQILTRGAPGEQQFRVELSRYTGDL